MIHCLHHNDLDGRAAAAIVAKRYPDAKFHEVDYASNIPFDEFTPDDEVVIVDFSLQKPGDWHKLFSVTRRVTWIDHHESAIKNFPDDLPTPDGVRDTRKCGALLTWDFFFPDSTVPKALRLIDQWDRGVHGNAEEVLNFSTAMWVQDTRPNSRIWTQVFHAKHNSQFFRKIDMQGEAVRVYQGVINLQTMRKAHEVELAGHRALAVNTDRSGSKIFDSVSAEVRQGFDLFVCYGFDGYAWTVHVYSDPDVIKANEIAERFGGGGHPGAAGFIVKELPWQIGQASGGIE